jgi:hypothetical protein
MNALDVVLADGSILQWQYSIAAFLSVVAAFVAVPYISAVLSRWYGQQR